MNLSESYKSRLQELAGINSTELFKEEHNSVWYHGSNNKFDVFDLIDNKTYKEIDLPVWFFTKDLNYAKTYGKYIYKVKLGIHNTFDTSKKEHFDLFIKYLKQDGKTDVEIDTILDEQFYKGIPYWTCNDAYIYSISLIIFINWIWIISQV